MGKAIRKFNNLKWVFAIAEALNKKKQKKTL